jgi:hypothetical protein
MSLRANRGRQQEGKNKQEDGSKVQLQDLMLPVQVFGRTLYSADLSKRSSVMSKHQMVECAELKGRRHYGESLF